MPSRPHPATLLAERAAERSPAELVDVVAEVVRETWAATRTTLLVATREETELVPLTGSGPAVALADDADPAVRCFVRGEPVADDAVWVPVTHRGDRVGVLGLLDVVAAGGVATVDVDELAALGRAVALHLAADRGVSDLLEDARRTEEMHVGAELLDAALPPTTYVDDRVTLAAVMEPTYGVGGDAFDHGSDGLVLRAAILDATGHGFQAAQVSAVAVAAFRSARRAGADLVGTWRSMDRWVGDSAGGERFATAALVDLRLDTGRITWLSAGHPSPVVLRADGTTQELDADPAPPLGTGLGGVPAVGEDYLEPGDLLVLHTDGLTEARGLDGRMLGLDGFLDALRAEVGRGGLLAERLRRLRLDLLARDDAWLSDDATLLVVEWHG